MRTIEDDHVLIWHGDGSVTDFSHCFVTSSFNMISWFSSSIDPGDLRCDNQQLCPVGHLSAALRDSWAEGRGWPSVVIISYHPFCQHMHIPTHETQTTCLHECAVWKRLGVATAKRVYLSQIPLHTKRSSLLSNFYQIYEIVDVSSHPSGPWKWRAQHLPPSPLSVRWLFTGQH